MKEKEKRFFCAGAILLACFLIWTALIIFVDADDIAPNGTNVGFATFNTWFHKLTGEHMTLYKLTDILEIIPLAVCAGFGVLGAVQLIKRKSIFKVDADIILLGVYYIAVILGFLLFEIFPINYRPVLIDGVAEASYPSSTTLLVLSVMPTLWFQAEKRSKNPTIKKAVAAFVVLYSLFMVAGRAISGVHWATDIIGSFLLSVGLFSLYFAFAALFERKKSADNKTK